MIARMRTASTFLEVLRSNPSYVPRRFVRLVDYSYGLSPASRLLRFREVGALLLLAVTVGGCGVRPGDHPVSSSCEWTEAGSGSLNLEKSADRGHLRYDALSAEDIAIRWADKYAGPRYRTVQRVPGVRTSKGRMYGSTFPGRSEPSRYRCRARSSISDEPRHRGGFSGDPWLRFPVRASGLPPRRRDTSTLSIR